jgi:enamine deaminase RidA (YjgF/YER057c/UK114 family)
MTVTRLNPPTIAPPVSPNYHHVAIGHGTSIIAIAGQIAIDQYGALVGLGDPIAQAQQAFRNFAAALTAAGCTSQDLLKNTIHVVNHHPDLVGPIFEAAHEAFGGAFPSTASTFLGVQALGHPDWLVEIDGLAVLAE